MTRFPVVVLAVTMRPAGAATTAFVVRCVETAARVLTAGARVAVVAVVLVTAVVFTAVVAAVFATGWAVATLAAPAKSADAARIEVMSVFDMSSTPDLCGASSRH
ncbi:hypothetical protein [Sphingomonas sp. ERG5]|uniref:hypothetical protein n=1 Tax=Sphingomonas sp. ERG5 TaxID=1381597 RepID=UPI000AA1A150|nr:hypothetical protein [Sphingomonas sp. ERG5]